MSVPDDLIKQAVKGERNAQEQIYRLLIGRLFRVVERLVGASDADDVMQDVFVNIFRKLHSFRFDADFATWAHRLAVNDALQHLRRARRRITVPLDETPAVVSEHERASDAQESINKAFSLLATEHQLILELKEVQRSSYAEIAQALGIPEGTVGSRLNRARSELRKRMIEFGWE